MCLSNMYPGADDTDYGAFVATMCDALERAGHAVERVAIDTRRHGAVATPAKYLGLARRALAHTRAVDVIYGHYLFPTGAIAAACGGLLGRPWVLTAHGRDVRNLSRRTIATLSTPGVTRAAAVICVSRYLASELRSSGVSLPPMYVANMGVDLDRFRPGDRDGARRELGVSDGPLVLAVGGLTERKNPLRLLQAVAMLRDRVPGVRLAFVGSGPLASAIDAGAKRLGIPLLRPGALPNEQVATWMAACDVLALPSTVEPLGIVALEAMASGRPVAATAIGGAAEVVGRAGTLVDPFSPESIAAGLARLLTDPPDPDACRRQATAHSVDRQAARVAGVLRTAVG